MMMMMMDDGGDNIITEQHPAEADADEELASYIAYSLTLCVAMVLYCVVMAFYLWYLGPLPP